MREEKLLNYLKTSCHGRENRKSGRELARTLGIHVKDLQKLVKRLRMDFLQGMADGLMEDIRNMRGSLNSYREKEGEQNG